MRKLKGNEGFTLVELMIVLSIIAILAVVLVPRVGSMKDSVREQGVVANINSVRALLEMEINDKNTNQTTERNHIIDVLNEEFVGGNAVTNPFTNATGIAEWSTASSGNSYSIAVYSWANGLTENVSTNTNYTNASTARKGQVLVWVCSDGYFIWGYGADGISLPYHVVK